MQTSIKGGDGRIEDKRCISDTVAGNCLSHSASLCQQDLRKHQNESKVLRHKLDKLISRQTEIEEEYEAASRKLASYRQAFQEQTEIDVQRELAIIDSCQQALKAEDAQGANPQSADCELLSEQRNKLDKLRIAQQETRAVITENLAKREEITAPLTGSAENGALIQQNKRMQEEIIELETRLNYLDMEKQKLAKAMALLTAQKPEAYELLSGSREEQIATVAHYRQYLTDFITTASDIERQQQVPVAAFLNQDIGLLLDKVDILKQRQFDLRYPEIATIDQVQELSLALEDMAQDYGWATSQLKTAPQSVSVNTQSVSELRQQANDLLVVAPPGLLAKLGLCAQWKKNLFDLIIQAKSMEELAHSPEALRRQIIAGVEGVLLECHHLAQRIYEACYKHLSACGHSIDQAYTKIQDEMTVLTKQLLTSSEQAQEHLHRQASALCETQQWLQAQAAGITVSQDVMQPEKRSLSGLLAASDPCQENINTREQRGQCLAEFEDKAASVNVQLAELADEKQTINLEIGKITKQLEDSISSDKATRTNLVREWISEIQQYRPENNNGITDRISAVRSGPELRRNCRESEAIARNLMAEQPGLVMLEIREWLLPVAVMTAEYTLKGYRDLTLFEKFIIKCIASGLQELKSAEAIASLLNLDVVLVDQHVNKLVQCCLLIESQNGGDRNYELSALGREVYQTGKAVTTLRSGNVLVTVNAQYEWLDIWKQEVSRLDDAECNLPVFRYYNKQEELALRNYYPADKQEVRHKIEDKIREWDFVQQQEPVIQVYEPQYQQDVKLHLAEFWLYDLGRDQVFCRVWSFAQQEFCSKLEFALTSLESRQRLDEVQAACNNNKQWTDFIAGLRSQAKLSCPTLIEESLSGDRHSVLQQAIDDTRERLLLMVPDCAEIAADVEIIKRLHSAVNRGCRIFIGWGNGQNRENEQQSTAAGVFERLHGILDAEGFPGVFTLYAGNQERKTALIDEQRLLTWLPGLTYQGKQLIQQQLVAKVVDKSYIIEQQLILEGVFLKQLERQLLQNRLADPIQCVTWFYALLTLSNHNYIREILAEEALAAVMDTHSAQTLFKLLAVYVKANQYEFGLTLLLTRLAAREDSQGKLTYWLDKLRIRNPKAYRKVMPIYKTVRKRK